MQINLTKYIEKQKRPELFKNLQLNTKFTASVKCNLGYFN